MRAGLTHSCFRFSAAFAALGYVFAPYLLANQVENTRACADRIVMLARGLGERGNEA